MGFIDEVVQDIEEEQLPIIKSSSSGSSRIPSFSTSITENKPIQDVGAVPVSGQMSPEETSALLKSVFSKSTPTTSSGGILGSGVQAVSDFATSTAKGFGTGFAGWSAKVTDAAMQWTKKLIDQTPYADTLKKLADDLEKSSVGKTLGVRSLWNPKSQGFYDTLIETIKPEDLKDDASFSKKLGQIVGGFSGGILSLIPAIGASTAVVGAAAGSSLGAMGQAIVPGSRVAQLLLPMTGATYDLVESASSGEGPIEQLKAGAKGFGTWAVLGAGHEMPRITGAPATALGTAGMEVAGALDKAISGKPEEIPGWGDVAINAAIMGGLRYKGGRLPSGMSGTLSKLGYPAEVVKKMTFKDAARAVKEGTLFNGRNYELPIQPGWADISPEFRKEPLLEDVAGRTNKFGEEILPHEFRVMMDRNFPPEVLLTMKRGEIHEQMMDPSFPNYEPPLSARLVKTMQENIAKLETMTPKDREVEIATMLLQREHKYSDKQANSLSDENKVILSGLSKDATKYIKIDSDGRMRIGVQWKEKLGAQFGVDSEGNKTKERLFLEALAPYDFVLRSGIPKSEAFDEMITLGRWDEYANKWWDGWYSKPKVVGKERVIPHGKDADSMEFYIQYLYNEGKIKNRDNMDHAIDAILQKFAPEKYIGKPEVEIPEEVQIAKAMSENKKVWEEKKKATKAAKITKKVENVTPPEKNAEAESILAKLSEVKKTEPIVELPKVETTKEVKAEEPSVIDKSEPVPLVKEPMAEALDSILEVKEAKPDGRSTAPHPKVITNEEQNALIKEFTSSFQEYYKTRIPGTLAKDKVANKQRMERAAKKMVVSGVRSWDEALSILDGIKDERGILDESRVNKEIRLYFRTKKIAPEVEVPKAAEGLTPKFAKALFEGEETVEEITKTPSKRRGEETIGDAALNIILGKTTVEEVASHRKKYTIGKSRREGILLNKHQQGDPNYVIVVTIDNNTPEGRKIVVDKASVHIDMENGMIVDANTSFPVYAVKKIETGQLKLLKEKDEKWFKKPGKLTQVWPRQEVPIEKPIQKSKEIINNQAKVSVEEVQAAFREKAVEIKRAEAKLPEVQRDIKAMEEKIAVLKRETEAKIVDILAQQEKELTDLLELHKQGKKAIYKDKESEVTKAFEVAQAKMNEERTKQANSDLDTAITRYTPDWGTEELLTRTTSKDNLTKNIRLLLQSNGLDDPVYLELMKYENMKEPKSGGLFEATKVAIQAYKNRVNKRRAGFVETKDKAGRVVFKKPTPLEPGDIALKKLYLSKNEEDSVPLGPFRNKNIDLDAFVKEAIEAYRAEGKLDYVAILENSRNNLTAEQRKSYTAYDEINNPAASALLTNYSRYLDEMSKKSNRREMLLQASEASEYDEIATKVHKKFAANVKNNPKVKTVLAEQNENSKALRTLYIRKAEIEKSLKEVDAARNDVAILGDGYEVMKQQQLKENLENRLDKIESEIGQRSVTSKEIKHNRNVEASSAVRKVVAKGRLNEPIEGSGIAKDGSTVGYRIMPYLLEKSRTDPKTGKVLPPREVFIIYTTSPIVDPEGKYVYPGFEVPRADSERKMMTLGLAEVTYPRSQATAGNRNTVPTFSNLVFDRRVLDMDKITSSVKRNIITMLKGYYDRLPVRERKVETSEGKVDISKLGIDRGLALRIQQDVEKAEGRKTGTIPKYYQLTRKSSELVLPEWDEVKATTKERMEIPQEVLNQAKKGKGVTLSSFPNIDLGNFNGGFKNFQEWMRNLYVKTVNFVKNGNVEERYEIYKDIVNHAIDGTMSVKSMDYLTKPDPTLNWFGSMMTNPWKLLADWKYLPDEPKLAYMARQRDLMEQFKDYQYRFFRNWLDTKFHPFIQASKDPAKALHLRESLEGTRSIMSLDPSLRDAAVNTVLMLDSISRSMSLRDKGLEVQHYFPRIANLPEAYSRIREIWMSKYNTYERLEDHMSAVMSRPEYGSIMEIFNKKSNFKDLNSIEKVMLQGKVLSFVGAYETYGGLPDEIAAQILPTVKNPRLMKRTGKYIAYEENPEIAIPTYLFSMAKKTIEQQFLEKVNPTLKSLEGDPSGWLTKRWLGQRLVNRAIDKPVYSQKIFRQVETSINDMVIKWVDSQETKGWLAEKLSGGLIPERGTEKLLYGNPDKSKFGGIIGGTVKGALGLDTAAKHIFKEVNTLIDQGPSYIKHLYKFITREETIPYEQFRMFGMGKEIGEFVEGKTKWSEFKEKWGADPNAVHRSFQVYNRLGDLGLHPMIMCENFSKGVTFMTAYSKAMSELKGPGRALTYAWRATSDMIPDFTVSEAAYRAYDAAIKLQFGYRKQHRSPLLSGPIASMSTLFWNYPMKVGQFFSRGLQEALLNNEAGRFYSYAVGLGMQVALIPIFASLGMDVYNIMAHFAPTGFTQGKVLSLPWQILSGAWDTSFGTSQYDRDKGQKEMMDSLGMMFIPQFRYGGKVLKGIRNLQDGYFKMGSQELPAGEYNVVDYILELLAIPPIQRRATWEVSKQMKEEKATLVDAKIKYKQEATKYLEDNNLAGVRKVIEEAQKEGVRLSASEVYKSLNDKKNKTYLGKELAKMPVSSRMQWQQRVNDFEKEAGLHKGEKPIGKSMWSNQEFSWKDKYTPQNEEL
jgi:hypothetical protein